MPDRHRAVAVCGAAAYGESANLRLVNGWSACRKCTRCTVALSVLAQLRRCGASPERCRPLVDSISLGAPRSRMRRSPSQRGGNSMLLEYRQAGSGARAERRTTLGRSMARRCSGHDAAHRGHLYRLPGRPPSIRTEFRCFMLFIALSALETARGLFRRLHTSSWTAARLPTPPKSKVDLPRARPAYVLVSPVGQNLQTKPRTQASLRSAVSLVARSDPATQRCVRFRRIEPVRFIRTTSLLLS